MEIWIMHMLYIINTLKFGYTQQVVFMSYIILFLVVKTTYLLNGPRLLYVWSWLDDFKLLVD